MKDRRGRSCDLKDTPPMNPLSLGDSPENFKKLVNSLYKPTTALIVYISLPLHL